MFGNTKKVHFVGIGGSGMSGIAEILINLGFTVSGSDQNSGANTRRLESLGAKIVYEHNAENVADVDVVVVSTAIKKNNVEVVTAHTHKISVVKRAEMLAELMRLKIGIAIAGSHGKTTTTTMVSGLMAAAGLDPTIINGGIINSIGTNAKVGRSRYLVAEADESDASFLHLSPNMVVVTNIDYEHIDFYGSMDALMASYIKFINKVPFYGAAILCLDNENIQKIIPSIERRIITYGVEVDAELMAKEICLEKNRAHYQLYQNGQHLGRITVATSGLHNVKNSLAAVAVGLELGLSIEQIVAGIGNFSGVKRRLESYWDQDGIVVIDDYGHHPTEIKATLAALRSWCPKRLIVVFQPHRYTRTESLFDDFARAFYQADLVIISKIYAAGQKPIPGISGKSLTASICHHGHRHAQYIPELSDIGSFLESTITPGDIVVTLGAGNIYNVARDLGKYLEQSSKNELK